MSPEVLRELLGRIPAMLPGVTLSNHSRHPVLGRVYPGVIPSPRPDAIVGKIPTSSSVEGILLLDITPLELRRLDWFEEEGLGLHANECPSCGAIVALIVPQRHEQTQRL
jgi:hypothetical protein